MLTVKLENEFLRGAVWVLGEDGITTEGKLPLVEDDPVVLELNEEIAEMYDSYFEFDSREYQMSTKACETGEVPAHGVGVARRRRTRPHQDAALTLPS